MGSNTGRPFRFSSGGYRLLQVWFCEEIKQTIFGFSHRFLWDTNVANKVFFVYAPYIWEHKVAHTVWKLYFLAKIPRFRHRTLCYMAEQRNKVVAPRDSSQSTPSTHTHVDSQNTAANAGAEVDKVGECELSSSRIALTKGFEQPLDEGLAGLPVCR